MRSSGYCLAATCIPILHAKSVDSAIHVKRHKALQLFKFLVQTGEWEDRIIIRWLIPWRHIHDHFGCYSEKALRLHSNHNSPRNFIKGAFKSITVGKFFKACLHLTELFNRQFLIFATTCCPLELSAKMISDRARIRPHLSTVQVQIK